MGEFYMKRHGNADMKVSLPAQLLNRPDCFAALCVSAEAVSLRDAVPVLDDDHFHDAPVLLEERPQLLFGCVFGYHPDEELALYSQEKRWNHPLLDGLQKTDLHLL